MNDEKSIIPYLKNANNIQDEQGTNFSPKQAIEEFEQLKNIALNCYDKNGNPNISAALRAVENKAKIAGLYSNKNIEVATIVKMNQITIDGEQLRLNIGEEFFNEINDTP